MVEHISRAAVARESRIAALGIAISLIPRGTFGCSTSSGVSEIQLPDTMLLPHPTVIKVRMV
jgi:hypothetical protein